MALKFFDGFDSYAVNSDAGTIWDSSSSCDFFITTGRFGGNCIRVYNTSPGDVLSKTFPNSNNTWIVGFAFKVFDVASVAPILEIKDSGVAQVELSITNDGTLTFNRNGTLLKNSDSLKLVNNTWYYIEVKVVIDNSGSYEVRVNGIPWIIGTGDTQNIDAHANYITIPGQAGAYQHFYDDFYICDGSGTIQNDFLGESKVIYYVPNAELSPNDFTAITGSNFSNLSTNNGDTTYITSSTLNARENYQFSDLDYNYNMIHGIRFLVVARKDDSDYRFLDIYLNENSIYSDGLSVDYIIISKDLFLNPETNSLWTKNEWDSCTAGFKITL